MAAAEIIEKANPRYREGRRKKKKEKEGGFRKKGGEANPKNGGVFLGVLREIVWVELQ